MSNRKVRLNLQQVRLERKQTLTEFHQYLTDSGVSIDLPQLSRIDRKVRGTSMLKTMEIAKVLGMPMESLIAEAEPCIPNN